MQANTEAKKTINKHTNRPNKYGFNLLGVLQRLTSEFQCIVCRTNGRKASSSVHATVTHLFTLKVSPITRLASFPPDRTVLMKNELEFFDDARNEERERRAGGSKARIRIMT